MSHPSRTKTQGGDRFSRNRPFSAQGRNLWAGWSDSPAQKLLARSWTGPENFIKILSFHQKLFNFLIRTDRQLDKYILDSRSTRRCPGSNVSLCMANSFWKGFLLNQPPHTPYSAAVVPGIDTIYTFWTIYFKIQTGVTWHCLGHHIEVIKCILRGKVAM